MRVVPMFATLVVLHPHPDRSIALQCCDVQLSPFGVLYARLPAYRHLFDLL